MVLFPDIFEAYEQEEYATMFSIEGRSLICTFLTGVTQDSAFVSKVFQKS